MSKSELKEENDLKADYSCQSPPPEGRGLVGKNK